MRKTTLSLVTVGCCILIAPVCAAPPGTAFTYQGRLSERGTPANGSYIFRFTVFDQAVTGSGVGSPFVTGPQNVSNGLFTVTLDFGPGVFTGPDRWLAIEVHTNDGISGFVALTPRQQITPTPYAIYAGGVEAAGISGALPAAGLNGIYTNALSFANANNSFTGNGGNLVNVNAAKLGGLTSSNFWQTAGNTGTTAGTHFLGTTDNQPLELRANNQRVLLLDCSSASPNILGGHPGNTIGGGATGATIAGGGEDSIYGSYYYNSVNSSNGTISGGYGGYIGTNSSASTIAGGKNGYIGDNADHSVIGGGRGNAISADAYQSVIAGGQGNGIWDFAVRSTISGGSQNAIYATNFNATIAGGQLNRIYSESFSSTISGGRGNGISAARSVIGGGQDNQMAGAESAVISGGYRNGLWNAAYASIGGGDENLIDGAKSSTISGGTYNKIETNAAYATIPGGTYALARSYGQYAYSSGAIGIRGDSQASLYVLRGVTTNAAVTELFLEGTDATSSSNRMAVPPNGVWTFDILLVATTAATTQVAGYQIKGMVANQGIATVLLGITVTPLYEDIGAWDANVVADSGHGALAVVVRGSAGATVRWVASVRTVELVTN